MSYELWTSQVTGQRRSGTKLSEMRRLFERNISTAAILESLKSCSADAAAEGVFDLLQKLDFDVAGVKERSDGPLIGFVCRRDLKTGLVADHVRRFDQDDIIADSTPLADTIDLLSNRDFQFVLVGPKVCGIVVTADLNKPPVRIFLFGLVSMLEMHLTFWITKAYPDDEWKGRLSSKRLRAAERTFKDIKSRNTEISLLNCLQFCDKRDLFVKNDEIRAQLKLGGRKAVDLLLKRAERLRNHLAHSQEDLASEMSWPKIAETVRGIERLLGASDELFEQRMVTEKTEDQLALW